MSTITHACRDLWKLWKVGQSTAYAIRRTDLDYAANVVEFDVGGVPQITDEDNDKFLAAKRKRTIDAAAAAAPVKRRPGRPRKIVAVALHSGGSQPAAEAWIDHRRGPPRTSFAVPFPRFAGIRNPGPADRGTPAQ